MGAMFQRPKIAEDHYERVTMVAYRMAEKDENRADPLGGGDSAKVARVRATWTTRRVSGTHHKICPLCWKLR